MNAVLVFDPANDLIFVKSNVIFRSTILKYAQQNGLLANTSAGRSQDYKRRQFERHFSDISANYTDTLMLMLTPYVASLRLSAELTRSREQHFCNDTASKQAKKAKPDNSNNNKVDESGDLLAKFMSSININHECQSTTTSKPDCYATTTASLNNQHNQHLANNCGGTCKESHQQQQWRGQHYYVDERQNESKQDQNGAAAAAAAMTTSISTLKMPVECLQDCQVVYCALYDFIFIHMQQLTSVSSFKMRLIKKRIDLFARLTLFLFGQALQSLKIARSTGGASTTTTITQQTLILRHAYERWFELQFEAELFLEVNERLIVCNDILHLCQETLRNISAELRRREQQLAMSKAKAASCFWRQLETHQHALLYSNSKLVSKFSCLNSQPILNDDLILLLLLVKIFNRDHSNEYEHEDSSTTSVRTTEQEEACTITNTYKSHYDIDPHTHQIFATTNKTATKLVQKKRQRRRRRKFSQEPETTTPKAIPLKMPHQLAIFLAAHDSAQDRTSAAFVQPTKRTYVPHMLRFVVLTPGITLLLVSELSTLAQLNLHLTRAHKLLLAFSAGGNSLLNFAGTGAGESSTYELAAGERQTSTMDQLKLSQLARVNDCISAIRNHFHANFRQLFPSSKVSSSSSIGQRDNSANCNDDDDDDDHDQLNDGHQIVNGDPPATTTRPAHESASANCPSSSASSSRRNSLSISSLFRKYFIATSNSKEEEAEEMQQSKRNNSDGHSDYDHEDGDIFCDYAASAASSAQVSDATTTKQVNEEEDDDDEGHHRHEQTKSSTIFDCLNRERQRLCRHLVRRLQELAQNNVHTYVKQTFSMPLDQHKRDALLTSVCATLRDSFSQLILAPQLEYLAATTGSDNQLRRFSAAQVDCARLLARRQLSDYLEYLAVKATGACNVPLGAPLTHDMRAICGFLYVDRARQVLIKSPFDLSSSLTKLNERELCEGDFESAIERHRRAQKRLANSDDDDHDLLNSSSSDRASYNSSDDNSYDEDDDELSNDSSSPTGSDHSSGDSIESIIYNGPPVQTRPYAVKKNQFLGTSQDVVLYENNGASSSASSSRQSVEVSATPTPTRDHQMARLASSLTNLTTSHNNSGKLLINDHQEDVTNQSINQPQVDANLVKGFAAFVYNRLANGQVNSFAQKNPAHDQHLAYFLWFKRQQDDKLVAPQQSRKLDVSHRLSAHFKSLPNVTCDDFFTNLTKSLILLDGDSRAELESLTCEPSESSTSSTLSLNSQTSSTPNKRRIKVYCQLRELDPRTGRHLLRRQLTRVREEEEVADEELDMEPAATRNRLESWTKRVEPRLMRSKSSHHLREQQDFNSFMRQQKSGTSRRKHRLSQRDDQQEDDEVKVDDDDNRIGCCELFCFHNTNLIVHKNQPAIEAQRLAQRLASLLASMEV